MKKTGFSSSIIFLIFVFAMLLYNPLVRGQETGKPSPALPDSINKIVSVSCAPCHTDQGGLMAKAKLNFSSWSQYSQEKQKEKADLISSVLEKDKMPPKDAREKRPEIVLAKEQTEIIIRWTDTFKTK